MTMSLNLRCLTRLLSSFALAAIATPAQVYTWNLEAPANAPAARQLAAITYDTARQRVVLFGGDSNTSSTTFADTWEWDGTDWLPRFSTNYPPARWYSAMAYDSARQRVVLFGGVPNSGNPLGDTWEWDGVNWVQRNPTTHPAARRGHCMAYDAAHQRVVLFAGVVAGFDNNETWEWDGQTWLQRTPAASPVGRTDFAMAYDPVRQRVVMFGGVSYPNVLYDTWEWNGTNWLPAAVLMGARRGHAMAYDAARQRVMLFGGTQGGGSATSNTFEYDGLTWTQLSPVTSPPPRVNHAMAYDVARQRMVLFSGAVVGNDTWTRGTTGTPAVATTFGNGCGTPPVGFMPSPTGRPIVGQTASATVVNSPTSIGAVAMGLSNTTYGPFTLPASLGGVGMPGCDLLQSSEALGLPAAPLSPTSLSFAVAVPPGPSLIGARVYLQAYVLAPGANALQVLVSNGIEWLFGDV